MAQLKFDKYEIAGTAQELADYVFAYESKQPQVAVTKVADESVVEETANMAERPI